MNTNRYTYPHAQARTDTYVHVHTHHLHTGLSVPRPPPLLPLLSGLHQLQSLGLAGVWAAQCVREASGGGGGAGAGAGAGSILGMVSLDVALAGLR